ncbi:MAG: hypothetical protein A3K14_01360 [Sulfurimonas sp. RIFCSPLOWO2_12_FULL_36_74]|uniref:Ig-like domain-containing protein n=1 Tax=Sulfurimonas sp. RIFCSPLOWO2_12_36_12 TaxID=1802253 RepID=UPI0008B3EA33|nr:hypothetical protein [Sulfurimonas sp. RIFCSPLOWO2_12_36_12]OHD98595.1 MAG: hypothetical protein A3J26_03860 [Sulfurimonas sp. RIFCSPLOWO2_02_FULL_36_28]OHE02614.1 MAG: hypothetical protein A2W82_05915 [Sulfurimonas sp. RIFCSPLOWO2_12_36_12]OHE06341.1 MAG: hypothetical protein A3K14_01360 [Sulfurimonas sp. RIFCSPLOWO2_12_FULL_36_74]
MATEKIIGQIEVTRGSVKIIGVDGFVRESAYGGYIYAGEQVVSTDGGALFQIKYSALPEATAYDGIFRILADGSVLTGTEAMASIAGDKNLIDLLETAAGEEGEDGSSSFTPTDIVAESSVLGFSRGLNPAVLGLDGIEVGAVMTNNPSIDIASSVEDTINNPPVATVDNITKIADHEIISVDVNATAEGTYVYEHNGWYGIKDDGSEGQPMIDSHDDVNEGIKFTFADTVRQASLEFKNVGDNAPSNDNILIELWNDGGKLDVNVDTSTIENNTAFIIDEGVEFDEIRVYALDPIGENGNPPTEFRISSVISSDIDRDIVLPFIIDNSMLLANDTDMDGDALHVELVDGNLYNSDGEIVGSVSIITDTSSDNYGDIQVTPNPMYEFDTDTPNYANFAYTVVDEHGASSESVLATIDVAVGEVVNPEINYDPTAPDNSLVDEFIIGTDSDIDVDEGVDILSDNILTISDTLNLSNISDINTIQLDENATVTGSGTGFSITASDVISATDIDNTLIIQSSDGSAINQVNVDASFGDSEVVYLNDVYYAQYYDSVLNSTLLIEIEPPIDAV